MLSLVEYSLTKFPSRRATPARRIMFMPAANSCRGPQFAWVLDFLKMFLLRHATVARRDTFLQAAASFSRDPQSPQVSSFGSLRRPAACFRSLCRFSRPLTGFTMVYSLGTSRCSDSDSMSTGVRFSHSRRASVVPWQAIVSFRHSLRE
jgi:hypothetical protein